MGQRPAYAAGCSVVCSSLGQTRDDRVLSGTVFAHYRVAARRSRGVPCPANTMLEALLNRR